jgi:hypothetical protein
MNQPHQAPFREHPGLWFLVGLGCLRLGYRKFLNRRSIVEALQSSKEFFHQFQPENMIIVYHPS